MHGRDFGNGPEEWGVSGYVYQNLFVIYDRRTESLWWPMDDTKWTAVSGSRKGEVVPFIVEPGVITLGEWRSAYPDTVVLLGDRSDFPEG